jgi:VWFA-related protein
MARWLIVVLTMAPIAAQQPRYRETVDVSRLLIDARVLDRMGRPMLDLGVEDFAVKIDGKRAPVESVQWLGGPDSESAVESTEFRGVAASPRGRLIVVLVQRDLERGRITGLMQAMTEAPAFLKAFGSEDRLAVLSFDSHVKIWLDFTNDLEQVRQVLQRGVLVERPRAMNQTASPSLVERLDPSRASRTYSIERALEVIADALAPIPGSKSVVLLGYGFGRLTRGGVMLDQRYDDARRALQNARASVFCLDITPADYHSLEVGLQAVAEDTGGFFVRTHIFTRNAFDRVAAVLAGHYVLFVEKPKLRPGAHRIDVKLTRRDGTVYAKAGYVD